MNFEIAETNNLNAIKPVRCSCCEKMVEITISDDEVHDLCAICYNLTLRAIDGIK